jgi:hypothetical protein
MRNCVNLMSDGARMRATLRLRIRHWAAVWGLLVVAAAPFIAARWFDRHGVEQEHAALEARYEPFGRLSVENRQLRAAAQKLVKDEKISLELSRQRPVAALLGLTSKAAAATGGELFVRKITFTQDPLADVEKSRGKMIIEAAGTLTYDVAAFVEALTQPPFSAVRVLSTEVESQDGVEQKNYTVECEF